MDDEQTPEEEAIALFAAAMEAIGVPYFITGPTAMSFYGKPR